MPNTQSLTMHIKDTAILHNVGSQLLKADVDSILGIEIYSNHINLIQKDATTSLRHALQMCGVKITSILKNNILLIENGLTGSHNVYPLDRVFSTTDDLFVTLSLLERIAVARKFIKQYRFGISIKENESPLSLAGVFSTSLAQTENRHPFGVVKSIRLNGNAMLNPEDPAKPTDAFWEKDTPADSELRNKTFDRNEMMEYLETNRIPKPKETTGGSFPDLENGDDFSNRSFDQNVDGDKSTPSTNMFNKKLPVTGGEDEAAGDETYALAVDLLPKDALGLLAGVTNLPVHDFVIENDRVWMYKLGVTTDLKVIRLVGGDGFFAFTGDQLAINGLTDEDLKAYSDIINTRYNHKTTTVVELTKLDEKGETMLMVKTGKSVKPNTPLSQKLKAIMEHQSKE